jgi:amino acid adenylation domain-containing protein
MSRMSSSETTIMRGTEAGERVRLSDAVPLAANFPLDRPRPSADASTLRASSCPIDAVVLSDFERLCASEQAGLFAGLYAVFALLIARCSGERQIAISTPAIDVSGHPVLLSIFSPGLGFRGLLAQTCETLAQVGTFHSITLTGRELPRQSSAIERAVLFRVRVVPRPDNANDSIAQVDGDLALAVRRSGLSLAFEWLYANDVLDESTIQRLARRFAILLESVTRQADDDVWRIPLLDREERQQVLVDWNNTRLSFEPRTLYQLFTEQSRRTPEATALVCRDVQLNYRELNERSNQLAHYLRRRGLTAESLVAVCLERSVQMVVGLLAILKAGGAYVPLDPQYPQERLDFMLADSGAHWMLTDTSAQSGAEVETISLDDPALLDALRSCPADEPLPFAGHDAYALAYVIYTSGSTGRPKGVCIEHRQAAALIDWAQRVYDAEALRGVLAATSICFDLSIFELFVPLCSGGRVILVAHPLDFEGIATAHELTLINTVPSAIKALIGERALPMSVKIANLAGEALPATLVDEIYRETAVEAVYNLYGPSEDTTYSTCALIRRGCDAPPIGKPLSNRQSYVLDAYLEPVPIGIAGDLYVGGAGVTRGYWKRPALTAERFIADPFCGISGARMYKTGDLARWSVAGELEFLGRGDDQVKLRGFRIELGEIRMRLLEIDGIDEAVVMVRDSGRGEPNLVAYIVPADSQEPESQLAGICTRHLAERLPQYMVPAVFVTLPALPLTPNGKIDRAALPVPPEIPATDYMPPNSELQSRVARLWQKVLQLPDALSITANFFDLGGHSILAMRLLARIRQEYGVALPIQSLFSAPTVEAFSSLIVHAEEHRLPAIRPVPRTGLLPLSFAQQRLWLVDQLEGGSAHYHLQLRFLIQGDLDVQALRMAIEGVVKRHESLRTVIVLHGQQPGQFVHERVEVPFTQIDLREFPPDIRSAEVDRIVCSDAFAPFALDRDSMLRMHLLRLGPKQHELLITLHHIAADGWSLDLLTREIGALYNGALLNREPTLPELPVQYPDYSVWQRTWMQGKVLEEQAQYWLEHLAGLPAVHSLPLDHPRRRQQNLAGAVFRTKLDAHARRALMDFCRQEQATLFMGLHAIFAVLLARYSGEEDIVVGTPIANREQLEFAGLIGFFVNTVVLRGHVPSGSTFTEILRQSRKTVLDAYSHQQTPFEYLVEVLQPARSSSHTPLFQIMLALQNAGEARLELARADVTGGAVPPVLAPFELTLEVGQSEDGLVLDWIYRSELFKAETVERMARHFINLMENAVIQPALDVWKLPLLGAKEREQILRWTSGAALALPSECVHEVFEKQARINPFAIAVADAQGELSYGELDRRANRCAHFLRERGIGPEKIAGIYIERSAEMVVAMLAVLKAGGIYLPLDVSLPPARIDFMIEDAGAQIVLTTRRWAGQMPSRQAAVVCVDEPAQFAAFPERPVDRAISGVCVDNGAYTIFTSGSTGQPKGVINTHAGLINLCTWHASAFGTDQSSRCTLVASIGFDAAVWELWSALLSGACAIPVDDTTRATPHLFAELMRAQRITHCFMPTGLLEAMAETRAFSSPNLQVVLCGGDKLSKYCLPPGSPARLVNCYGPTEAAVVSTAYEMAPESLPLIGRPIANVQAYVLNRAQELQAAGVIGELYIGGANLARGYVNAPTLTEECFIHNAFSSDSQSRLYRTGDFVRLLHDGNLEFIGRRDGQIKLRGMRIELGEIEKRLAATKPVQSALVLLREDTPGRQRLVGYVTVDDGAAERQVETDIQAALRRELPEHMVPDAIIVLNQWPVTDNGKIDRARLPQPAEVVNEPHDARPNTETERALHAIWAQLLKRESIALGMNFFAAGGNSLLVTQMIHLIHERMSTLLTVKDIFGHQTLRGLAGAIDAHATAVDVGPLRSSESEFLLSPSQFRIWYVEQVRATNEHNMPVVLELPGWIEPQLLERALNYVIARHEMLRTGFTAGGTSPLQVTQASIRLALETSDLAGLPDAEREIQARALGSAHATCRFDIAQPPLMRALLIKTGAAEHRLHLNFHHLIFDGWSLSIFLNELIAIYEALAGSVQPQLPPLQQRYGDFVMWQRRWLESGEARAQADFWKEYLKGSPERLSLAGQAAWPKDVHDPSIRIAAYIPAPTRERLQLLAQDTHGTLFSVLYSVFVLLLGRLDDQRDLTIGIPINGRHIQGMQHVIGNFLNNLPVRTQWQPQQAFSEYLAAQTANLQQVFSNQDYPFEKILEMAPHLRSSDSTPIFQVFFNMLSAPRNSQPRLFEARPVDAAEIEPKFNLTLYVEDEGNEVWLRCHYKPELFTPSGIKHLLNQYIFLLEQVGRNAALPCSEYSLRLNLPGESGGELTPQYCWTGTVQDIFRQHARNQPDATAIIEADQQWTYGEVLGASAALAQDLMGQGVGRGDVVGIIAARRASLGISMFGVLQAGAAFSILNPEYPVERICQLIEILKPASILFTGDRSMFDARLVTRIEGICRSIYLPVEKDATGPAPVDFTPARAEPEQLACVTFTSGTTGIPKAVAGTHIGLAGYLSWVPQWLHLSQHDRFSMLSGLGHDPLQRDIFSSLCIGATLVIPAAEVIAPDTLARWVRSNAISFVHLTPAMVEILCTTDEREFPDLRIAFVTGDKLPTETVRKLMSYNSSMCVLNSYGTTETQRATTYFVASRSDVRSALVPISEASPDTVVRVLNATGIACGLGEVGDIVMESYALSKGYLNDERLTNQVFRQLEDGRRRYRTGDIGCRLPNSIIFPLGRKDTQVKIHGFRIELGEIEAHVRNFTSVQDAAVLALRRPGSESELVAYVVPGPDAYNKDLLQTQLQQHLKSRLPSYMVPAAIVLIGKLPLTPNGKLDRGALPEPDWNAAAGSVAPRNDLERVLSEIWMDVLGLQRVGMDDNFFALGGNSMLMVLLFTRIRQRLGQRIGLTTVLSSPTIAEQARSLMSPGE